ncbi:MAG: peptidoglycan DD-metalloendopeptidase family protein [Bacteroidota bacterium]
MLSFLVSSYAMAFPALQLQGVRDTNRINKFEVRKGVYVDCVWVKAREYYQIWSDQKINPYGFDPTQFKEVAHFQLYDPKKREYWAPPLNKIVISSYFGPRNGRYHYGIDLALPVGENVYSVFDGIIRISSYNGGYGNFVVIRHKNGLETLYGHLSKLRVKVGDEIKAGEIIGKIGSTGYSTGPHLHFSVLYQGTYVNPTLLFDFSKGAKLHNRKLRLFPQHFFHVGNPYKITLKYKVKKGETLAEIADKYGIEVAEIKKRNRLKSNQLKVNQILIIQ